MFLAVIMSLTCFPTTVTTGRARVLSTFIGWGSPTSRFTRIQVRLDLEKFLPFRRALKLTFCGTGMLHDLWQPELQTGESTGGCHFSANLSRLEKL